jgi:hypothetical protein
MRTAYLLAISFSVAAGSGAKLLAMSAPAAPAAPKVEKAVKVAAAPVTPISKLDGTVRSAMGNGGTVSVVVHFRHPSQPSDYVLLQEAGAQVNGQFPEISAAKVSVSGSDLARVAEIPAVTRVTAQIDAPAGSDPGGLYFAN